MSVVTAMFVSYFWSELLTLGSIEISLLSLILLYGLYYFNYKFYRYTFIPKNPGNIYRGKFPPAFPNGWFVACSSNDLKNGQVKAIVLSGNDLVLFRGEDGKAFILEAFCPHSGAHLGVGGLVKHKSCIQCPFHGWLFDGNTGNLVAGSNLIPRKVDYFEYTSEINKCGAKADEILKHTGSGHVSLRKYITKELNGFLYVWIHSDPSAQPTYQPLDYGDFVKDLQHRGSSLNIVHTHSQDIVENGGDIRHFLYVHSYLLPFTDLLQLEWDAKWYRGDDPDIKLKMKHPLPWVTKIKYDLFDKYLTEENKSSIGVMNLTLNIVIPKVMSIFFFNATIFQVGPGLVYLFLASPFYSALYFQHTITLEKFHHQVYHELYSSWHLPYWSTAAMLRLEAQQVTNDTFIWNKKIFANNPKYNLMADADLMILEWRRWFSQFYEGCAEKEAEKEKYTW